jgi:hypothetical protein
VESLFTFTTGILLSNPSGSMHVALTEKNVVSKELSEIKSVQLELVKHSLLSRKLIKIDKQIAILRGIYIDLNNLKLDNTQFVPRQYFSRGKRNANTSS